MKITYDRLDALMTALSRYYDDLTIHGVRVSRDVDRETRRVKFSVNWASLGSTDPLTACQFGCWLMNAAAIVDELNRAEFDMVRGDDPDITNAETFEAAVAEYLEALKSGRYALAHALVRQ